MSSYTVTEEIVSFTPGTVTEIARPGLNSILFILDDDAAAVGATINGVAFPAGAHRLGAPDPHGCTADTYMVSVPFSTCKVVAVLRKTIFNQ
jgi:hypothetical protein